MLEFDFIEQQYLGLNKMSLTRRIALVVFCFFAYYWRENHNKEGEVYLLLGFGIIIFSVLLLFVLHFETKVINNSIILEGLWTSRKVKIDIASLVSARKIKYSNYIINRSVYNLHFNGVIRFYTRGKEAIEITDRDGLIYLIGTQKAEDLFKVINEKLN